MNVSASAEERGQVRTCDDVVAADVVMDRGFTVPGKPERVWPWIVQLGKARAGWYLPRSVERFVPRGRRALRRVDERWQQLAVGDVVPDYGGANATFEVIRLDPVRTLGYWSRRGMVELTWELTLAGAGERTRVLARLRMGPVRRVWLARTAGEAVDAVTIAGMAAGLAERLRG